MKQLKPLTLSQIRVSPLTVERFFEAAHEVLALEVLAGRTGMLRTIEEPVLHRPGLALTGFFEHFAWRRLQVLGHAEMSYLRTLGAEERLSRWLAMLQWNIPGIILCGSESSAIGGDLLAQADRLGVPVLLTARETRSVFSQGPLILHELSAPRASVHGTLVDVGGIGVLLEGPPGIGKSETALGLLRRGNALIADDITLLAINSHGSLTGTAPVHMRGFMEIRGLGLLHVPTLYGIAAVKPESRLDLIVSLRRCTNEDDIDRVGSDVRTSEILGVHVQHLIIPVAAGRDFVNVVETAAATFKMRNSGVDAAAVLDAQLLAHYQSVEKKL